MAAISKAALPKYDQLRLKTDRQLIRLAHTELDLGIRDAREALQSAENWASARARYLLAERAHLQAARLISLTGDIGKTALEQAVLEEDAVKEEVLEGHELEVVQARLAQLREALEGLSVLSAPAVPAGDKTPALARALWKAKGCPDGSADEDWFQAERVLQARAACVGSEARPPVRSVARL